MNSYDMISVLSTNSDLLKGNMMSEIIRRRRSIYADDYLKKSISSDLILEILTNASWAPTHKMTEPWRFVVLQGKQLINYGKFMADYYLHIYSKTAPNQVALAEKLRYLRNYPLSASCIIAIILNRSASITIPEWEEVAAVSCAVQNMALTCTAYDLGSYWATNGPAIEFVKSLGLLENEQSLGLFFIGHYDAGTYDIEKKRTPIEQKTTWLN